MEVCTASDLNISRLDKAILQAYLHLAQSPWSSMPSFLPGIPICLSCSDSKAFYRWPDCLPGNTYLLHDCGMAGERVFWLNEEELDVHQDQTDEWHKVCELHHICVPYPSQHLWDKEQEAGWPTLCSCKNCKVNSMQEAPNESFIHNALLCIHCSSDVVSKLVFFLLSFHFIFFQVIRGR